MIEKRLSFRCSWWRRVSNLRSLQAVISAAKREDRQEEKAAVLRMCMEGLEEGDAGKSISRMTEK
jgi:hypothetical protein